ncbi:MAG: hypothetical protein JJ975_09985 [Bacteroidia bacterium]|nr:hypothetical protein [Bacteroidia bacterium]
MKRLFKSATKRSSVLIIGFLLLANMLAFGLASQYLGKQSVLPADISDKQEEVMETGWQVFSWGYSLLEYIKFQPHS